MAAYVKLHFHRVGPLAHKAAVERIDAIPGVEVVYDHTRSLGMFERQRLFVEEWDCRVLFYVQGADEYRNPDRREADELDPYRTLDLGEIEQSIPSALAELIEEIEADYALVKAGWLRFSTRHYETPLLDTLAGEVEELAGRFAEPTLEREGGRLFGRVRGAIPAVHAVGRHLQRCGLVDRDSIAVGYE